MKKNSIRAIIFCLTVTTMAVMVVSRTTARQESLPKDMLVGPAAQASKPADPKLDPALYALIHPAPPTALEAAGLVVNAAKRDFDLGDGTIQVVAETRVSAGAAAMGGFPETSLVRNQIAGLGGKVETSYKNLIQARMSPAAVEALSQSDLVDFVRLPLRPFTTAISEGVALTGADQWKSLEAYRTGGAKPKVAVLDLGFSGYTGLLGSDLPSHVTTRSFRADGNLTPSEVHGAACAEIVYDMCPNIDLFLVNFNTDVEQHNAVDWLISQGVQVISYSIGWTNAGDGKGTGPICADVEKAAAAGIAWCSAAGNDANSHWEETFSDTNSNGYHNFTSANEIQSFWVPAYSVVSIWLNWDDWGGWNGTNYSGSNQDYNLELYYWNGSSWSRVAGSYSFQTGTQWPSEAVGYWYSSASTYWGVLIHRWNTTRNCKLEVFTRGNSSWDPIQYAVPAGSLTIPADAPGAFTVGATDAVTDEYHPYSSRGPTHDGRAKPDFTAPSGVTGTTYGTRQFYGTSAATPHLAGAFGLLKDKTRYSVDQIRQIFENRAIDMGTAGKDNTYGTGRLDLHK